MMAGCEAIEYRWLSGAVLNFIGTSMALKILSKTEHPPLER